MRQRQIWCVIAELRGGLQIIACRLSCRLSILPRELLVDEGIERGLSLSELRISQRS